MNGNLVRAQGLDVSEAADGFIVYHPERDRVHYLNHTAELVLEFCTGDNSPSDIAQMLQAAYDLPSAPDGEVRECLSQLASEGLVTERSGSEEA